jgi:phosphatidylglycerophosphate synthase
MSASSYLGPALAAIVLLTMPAYAVVSRRRVLDPDVARRPTTVLLGYWVRDWAMWVIGPLERVLVAARVSPDALNVAGALMGLAAGVAYALRAPAAAGWCVLLGGLADILDGRIARRRGIASSYGEFLDSMLDRFAEVFAFVGLTLYFAAWPWALLATALAAGSSLLVSYARAKGGEVGVSCRGGVMQRAERLVTLAVASLLDGVVTAAAGWRPGMLLAAAVGVIGVGALGTAIYRTVAIARALRAAPAAPSAHAKVEGTTQRGPGR